MLTLLKNRTLQTIASANFFTTLGVSLFNIILLTYAKNFPNPHWFVAIVSVVTVVPYVFGGLTGRLADQTRRKTNWLIGTKVVQAGLYLVLAQVITQQTVVVFYVVVAINFISDLLGRYGGSILTIVIQDRIDPDDRQQVMGLNASISTLVEPLGQTLGVLIIAQWHDYALAGIVNALTFIGAASCLLAGRSAIQSTPKVAGRPRHIEAWPVIQRVMLTTTRMGAVSYLGILMILNVATMSIDTILNLMFIDLVSRMPVSYSVAILMVNVVFVTGSVLGGITKNTWFDRLSLFQLLLAAMLAPMLTYVILLVVPQLILILGGMFAVGFMSGKLDPKMFAIMMPQIDPHLTGTVFGTISSIVTLAAPVGSVGIVLLYNLVGATAACSVMIGVSALALIWAVMAHRQ